MRRIATRTIASVLAALLAFSCGTVRESRQPDIEERIFLPRAPRVVASPVVGELELRKATEELLPYVNVEEARAELRRMVSDPRFHGRQPGELRVVLASWGSGPVALEEIGREYRAWCAAVHRTNCHEGPLTDSIISGGTRNLGRPMIMPRASMGPTGLAGSCWIVPRGRKRTRDSGFALRTGWR